jgi:hypothetical protein
VAEQYLLDLEGGDIFAPTSDGVFETIDKPKIAVGMANDRLRNANSRPSTKAVELFQRAL